MAARPLTLLNVCVWTGHRVAEARIVRRGREAVRVVVNNFLSIHSDYTCLEAYPSLCHLTSLRGVTTSGRQAGRQTETDTDRQKGRHETKQTALQNDIHTQKRVV